MKRSIMDARVLSGVTVLATVVERGSVTRAAELLGLSASGVSRAISRLEQRLGVRLLDRTTRTLRLTAEGARLNEVAAPHLAGTTIATIWTPALAPANFLVFRAKNSS